MLKYKSGILEIEYQCFRNRNIEYLVFAFNEGSRYSIKKMCLLYVFKLDNSCGIGLGTYLECLFEGLV